jgi:hypothetical protein
MTERIAAKRGSRFLLAARVPSSLKGCGHVGLDVAAWCERRLIDFLTAAPFLSTESDVPVHEFKRACGVVPIYTGIEFTIGNRQMTREEKRASAALLYDAGSDGMYLFNYFVAWDAGLQVDIPVLAELANPDSLVGKDKLYTLAVPRYPVPNVSASSPLPLDIGPGGEASVRVRLVEPRRPRTVRLRIECAGVVEPRDVRVDWNGLPLAQGSRPLAAQIFPQPVEYKLPPADRSVEFDIDPSRMDSENTLKILSAGKIRVEWIYVAVRHNGK